MAHLRTTSRLLISILSGLLCLLGFSGCKSSRKAVKEKDGNTPTENTPVKTKPTPADDNTRIQLIYGAPPAQYRE